MFGVNSGVCLGFDKWLGYDVLIMGARALGGSLQCWHLSVSVLALECLSAGTCVFQCWRLFVSVLAVKCFSAGTCLFQCWHSGARVPRGPALTLS